MVQTTPINPGKDTYEKVLEAVRGLLDKDHKHISICWPTSTTALFMRKRMNRDIAGSLGVRNTTSAQLRTLIEDASSNTAKYSSPKTLDELAILSKVARQVLPHMSQWRSTNVIDETLRIVSSASSQSQSYIKSNFPLAERCLETYSKISNSDLQAIEPLIYGFDVDHIIGTCLIVKNNQYEQDSDFLIESFPKQVRHVFCPQEKSQVPDTKKLLIHEDVFDEIDWIFKEIVNSRPRADSTIIIVPDSAYKRLVLSRSHKFSIPTSGKTEMRISDHELIIFVKAILEIEDEPKRENLVAFLQRFTWLTAKEKNNDFLAKKLQSLVEQIQEADNISTKFQQIVEFLTVNMSMKSFETDDKTKSWTQQAFSILIELSKLEENCSTSDCIYLINLLGQNAIPGNKLGDGIYVALPDEIIGSYFDCAYIVGLRDRYIPPLTFVPSLINRDQYLVLGIQDELVASSHLNSSLLWLKACAEVSHFSSSQIDITGKETALPHWVNSISSKTNRISIGNKNESFHYDETFLKESLGTIPNSKNISAQLVQPESISATAIETLATCPLKYLYRHEFKLQSDYENANPDLIDKMDLGNIVHNLLQDYVEQNQTPVDLFNALDLLLEEFYISGELPNTASININRTELVKMLDSFLELDASKLSDATQSEVAVEDEFQFADRYIKIKGKIDRVDTYSTGKIQLIDYKTGKLQDKSSIDFYHFGRKLQLAIYALLIPGSNSISALEYWYLGENSTKTCAENINIGDLEDLKLKVENILSILPTGTFLAKPFYTLKTKKETKEIEHCSKCEFDEICYSENKNFWDLLSQKSEFEEYTSVVVGEKE